MTRPRQSWGTAGVAAVVLFQVTPSTEWQRVAPPSCPRSALLPPGATHDQDHQHTRFGTVDYRTVAVDFGSAALSLTVIDLPPELAPEHRAMLLPEARGELAGHYHGKVLGYGACTPAQDGCQAVRFSVTQGVGLVGAARLFVGDQQLVVANAVAPDDEEHALVAERFFASVERVADVR